MDTKYHGNCYEIGVNPYRLGNIFERSSRGVVVIVSVLIVIVAIATVIGISAAVLCIIYIIIFCFNYSIFCLPLYLSLF